MWQLFIKLTLITYACSLDGAYEKKWLPWRALYFDLKEDATLTYTKFKGSKGYLYVLMIDAWDVNIHGKIGVVLDVSTVSIEKIPLDGNDNAQIGKRFCCC